jgi:LacI family transcriptional regulator
VVKQGTESEEAPLERRIRPTMREVAALSSTSIKTVSRVINNEPGVSDDLVQRVLAAARALNYQPDLTASSLRRSDRKTRTIGLLLENVANPFSSALHRAIEDIARARGVVVFAGSVDEDAARETELAHAFLSRRVDGLIIVPAGGDQSYLAEAARRGTPIVFADRKPRFIDADSVVTDNTAGAQQAVSHLIHQGHRRIAFLGDLSTISTAQERYLGYQAALGQARVKIESHLVFRDLNTADAAQSVVTALLEVAEPPTAIFASQNLVTVGALRALRNVGKHRTIAVVGFDDLPFIDLLDPGVTLAVQDVVGMGSMAAELLFRRLDGHTGPTEQHVLPVELRLGGSGEIAGPYL